MSAPRSVESPEPTDTEDAEFYRLADLLGLSEASRPSCLGWFRCGVAAAGRAPEQGAAPDRAEEVRRALQMRFGTEAGRVSTEVERAADNKDFSPQALRSAVVILRALAASGLQPEAPEPDETTTVGVGAAPSVEGLTDEQIDAIWDRFEDAPTMSYRYLVTEAIIAALSPPVVGPEGAAPVALTALLPGVAETLLRAGEELVLLSEARAAIAPPSVSFPVEVEAGNMVLVDGELVSFEPVARAQVTLGAPLSGAEPHMTFVAEEVLALFERGGNARLALSLLRDGLKERKRRDASAPSGSASQIPNLTDEHCIQIFEAADDVAQNSYTSGGLRSWQIGLIRAVLAEYSKPPKA